MATLEVVHKEKATSLDLDSDNITFICREDETLTARTEKEVPASAVIAFLRTRRGWMLIDYLGEDTYVNDIRVADAKLVSDHERIRFLNYQARVISKKQQTVVEGSSLLEVECPYDSVGFQIGDQVIYCPDCETPHHLDCWEASSKGCANDLRCSYHKPLKEMSK